MVSAARVVDQVCDEMTLMGCDGAGRGLRERNVEGTLDERIGVVADHARDRQAKGCGPRCGRPEGPGEERDEGETEEPQERTSSQSPHSSQRRSIGVACGWPTRAASAAATGSNRLTQANARTETPSTPARDIANEDPGGRSRDTLTPCARLTM